MENVFRRTRVIGAEHIDQLGHVNNVVWLELILDLARSHYNTAGLDLAAERDASGCVWVVRRHEIDYVRSALPDETIVEQTWVSVMRGAQSVRHCLFTREADGEKLVASTTQWVWVDGASQRPRRLPKSFIEGLPVSEGPTG